MLMILFKFISGIVIVSVLLIFVFIDLIHNYCKKHVDKIEGRQVEIE